MTPARFVFLVAAVVAGGLIGFAMWWLSIPLPLPSLPSLPSFGGGAPLPTAHIVLIALVAGLVGGIVANLLGLGVRGRFEALQKRVWLLETKWRQRMEEEAASRATDAGSRQALSADGDPRGRQPRWEQQQATGMPALEANERIIRPGSGRVADTHAADYRLQDTDMSGHGSTRDGGFPSPSRPGVSIKEVVAAYGKIAAGYLSRSEFENFFSSYGPGGPVEVTDGGKSISRSENSDAFLTSMQIGSSILVFPSYSFIANRDTQFTTIASVPDNVASLFSLKPGSGEIVVASPAVFSERERIPELESMGEIKGFAG